MQKVNILIGLAACVVLVYILSANYLQKPDNCKPSSSSAPIHTPELDIHKQKQKIVQLEAEQSKLKKQLALYINEKGELLEQFEACQQKQEEIQDNAKKDERKLAVFTLMTTNNYIDTTRTLGFSLKEVKTKAKLVCLVLPEVTEDAECLLRSAGWEIQRVKSIPAPVPPTLNKWKDMFTKLVLWNLTQWDKIVYLDSDTIALQNFDEIYDSPAEFSAVGDFNNGNFDPTFNAGVFALTPSTDVFNQLMAGIKNTNTYHTGAAEQSFLNMWYAYKWLRLPYGYNGNLAVYQVKRDAWNQFGTIKIIHYTMVKPLLELKHDDPNVDWVYKIYFDIYHNMIAAYDKSCEKPPA